MLIACIRERAKRLDVPADLPVLRDRETLAQVLVSFGTKFVPEVSDPAVIAVTSKPEILCQRTGVELGVGEELSVSLAMKITNPDGCRVFRSELIRCTA
jgi:hypothetical protein